MFFFSGYRGSINPTFLLELETTLFKMGLQTMIINYSIMRNGLCSNLKELPQNLGESSRRAIELSKIISNAGWIVITDLISLDLSDLNLNDQFQNRNLHEIKLLPNSRINTPHIFLKTQKGQQSHPSLMKKLIADTTLSISIDGPEKSPIIKIISQHIKEIFSQNNIS